jgi:prepilin peptidase dependent protein B
MLMNEYRVPAAIAHGVPGRTRQAGATLMEAMISLALSTLVIIGMVILMGNSLGTTNRITQMAQLNDELRNVMSMMTRDARRANYSAASVLCYGNAGCGEQDATRQEGGDTAVGDLVVADGCLIFQLDRVVRDPDDGTMVRDGNATNDSKGGFRLIDDDGVGVIQMWVNVEAAAPACGDAADADGWMPVTDPNIIDIVAFTIDDDESVETSIFQESGASTYTQRQRHLELAVEGELVLEQRMGWAADADNQMIRRRVEDVIIVRNDFLSPPVPAP